MTDGISKDGLITHRKNGVLTLVLDRPQVRNALTIELLRELRRTLELFSDDESLHAAILTGADPAFCAGLDMKAFADPQLSRAEAGDAIRSLAHLPKPIIAAVNGAARAGGVEMALGCDFILCADNASFADTHAAIGALPACGMTSRLPFAVGSRWAKEITLAGAVLDAPTALRIGLVNEVLAADRLLPRARELAENIAARPQGLIGVMRGVIDRGAAGTLEQALEIEMAALAAHRKQTP